MRLFLTTAVTVGLMLFSAASAQAIALSLVNESATNLTVGDTFTIELRLDTEGETQITSLFASVFADPALFAFVSGTSPGAILVNFSTFETVGKVTDPFVLGTDPAGNVRAASFATANPVGTGVSNPNQLLATLTFQAIGAGAGSLSSLAAAGDDITVATVSQTGSVSFGQSVGITIVPIPEPGTALLMGLGLLGLAASGRRA